MPQELDDRKRLVVPRWRPFRAAAALGMLGSTKQVEQQHLNLKEGELENARDNWLLHRDPSHAADFLDAALIIGRPDLADDAAVYLVDSGTTQLSRELAQSVINPIAGALQLPPEISIQERHKRIARAKRILRAVPRNPVAWIDLAREYSALSQNEAAARAVRIALALAPDDRFVARAAARFYLHNQEPDTAHSILSSLERTRLDPWLASAEIVTARAAGQTSRLIRQAQRMVESTSFLPRHISELAGALGTLEHEAGSRKGTKKMFRVGLLDPTENTVAQASWVARHGGALDPPEATGDIPRAFEAGAWEALRSGDYKLSVELAWKWLFDEPFATRPAFFGAWVATTALGDYELAIEFVTSAQIANPNDPRLLAELAFCHASNNNVELAEAILSDLPSAIARNPEVKPPHEWQVLFRADQGLIEFRKGHFEEGRKSYRDAIQIAEKNDLKRMAALAFLYYVREETLAGAPSVDNLIKEAAERLRVLPEVFRQMYDQLLSRISAHRDSLRTYSASNTASQALP